MSPETAALNCTTSPWVLKPNPDISGIGILIGFAATAYSTLLFCVAYYLFDRKHVSNPVDQRCINRFYRLFNQSRPAEKWAKALEAAVLTYSDQQIITGIAIMISGYSQLRGGLAVYYWQLTVDLAWFSSITHLTTLTCLRYYFQERRGLKLLRMICMAVTAGMLSSAMASTGYLGGENFSYDYPAWCLFHRERLETATGKGNGHPEGDDWTGYYDTDYVALVLLFLCVSYGVRAVQLFPSSMDKLREKCHARLRTFAQGRLSEYKSRASGNSFRTYWASVYILALAFYCIFKAAVDLYSSMLWEVSTALRNPLYDTHTDYLDHKITWLGMALVWGSSRIIMDRDINFDHQAPDPGSSSSQDLKNAVLEDDTWGFGQVVAVALLLAPLFSFFESVYESVIMDKKNYEQLPTSAPTSLVSPRLRPSPGSSSAEPWTDLYECAWFRSLVWLIYLQSLGIAAVVIILFPIGNGPYNLRRKVGFLVRFFLAWFGFDLTMLLLFAIMSLSLCHVQDASALRWTWRAKIRANGRTSRQAQLLQTVILVVSVLILTVSSTLGFFFFLAVTKFKL